MFSILRTRVISRNSADLEVIDVSAICWYQGGGKFLEANTLVNPQTGRKFSARDFFVGAEVTLNGHMFKITAADERTMQVMQLGSP